MNPTKRIIVNTIAQYVKAIINIGLSLYSTRLVLEALDVDNYGIYSLVAGVVGILGYLTNALVVTTQRYLSFYHGAGEIHNVRKMFANSLLLHLAIGALIGLILFCIKSFVMHELNIETARLQAAMFVFDITVLMLIITILTSPFKALLVARENIVYISIVEVFDGVLRLLLAFSLFFIGTDKLIVYAIGMGIILAINFVAYVAYVLLCYEESHFKLRKETFDMESQKKLLGFAGWTTYGMISTVCQTQGTSIALNHFFGTAINAAYGLASQVNGAIRFVSTSVLNAMNPQIMKEEGNGDRQRMLALAGKESKFSTALMMILAIPMMAEMPAILEFWLKSVPQYTCLFCRALLLAFLIDQFTLGLHAANQATGVIRTYSLLMFTPKILYVFVAWAMLSYGCEVSTVMLLYVFVELAVAIGRIPFLHYTADLNVSQFMHSVIYPLIPLGLVVSVACLLMIGILPATPLRFLISIPVAIAIGILVFWRRTLTTEERSYVNNIIRSRLCNRQ